MALVEAVNPLLNKCRRILTPDYYEYCTTVSRRTMAINLETAALLLALGVELRPNRALDMGSGFTSYVLGLVCDDVTSVDDDPAWLEKTGKFLVDHDQSDAGLVLWDGWQPEGLYGLIVYDFAAGERREEGMSVAASCLAPGGALLFDDAQHEGHHAEMIRVCEAHGFEVHDVREATEDMIHRYALLAVAP